MFQELAIIWLNKYLLSIKTPPSLRKAGIKNTVNDPAIAEILKAYYQAKNLPEGDLKKSIDDHSLLMTAENIQGNLLEEYIASKISIEPYNFIWCRGETIKAADFMIEKNGMLYLLQIKNKYNTENSSSSKIRDNTSIMKWYRLDKKKEKKVNVPVYKWSFLNQQIEIITGHLPSLNEEGYINFVRNVLTKNPSILI